MDIGRKSRAALAAFGACAALVIVIGACVLHATSSAYAQPNIDGQCYIHWRGESVTDDLFYVTMPDGRTCEGHCIDPGLPAAEDGYYAYSGTWNGTDYDIVVDATEGDPAPSQIDVGQGCQHVGRFTWAPLGSIDLTKLSSLPSISDGNTCYSLAGAEYGVYRDAACTECVTTMTTDSAGHAQADDIVAGTYYVKELTAPSGYALSDAAYTIEVAMNETAHVGGGEVYDTPQSAPVSVLLQKTDAETGTSQPQSAGSLEGAVFSVRFYGDIYQNAQEALSSGEPLRSWTFSTQSDGAIHLEADDLIEGSDLYANSLGENCLPLGTVVFEEVQAPEGYVLDSTPIALSLSSTGSAETAVRYETPVVSEQVIRGDIEFTKSRVDSQQRLANIPFEITNLTTGESHIVVTDENGYASTAACFNKHTERTNANDILYTQMRAEECAETADSANDADVGSDAENACSTATSTSERDANAEAGNAPTSDAPDETAPQSTTSSPEETALQSSAEAEDSGQSPQESTDTTTAETSTGQAALTPSPSPSSEDDASSATSSEATSERTALDLRSGIWFGQTSSGASCAPNDSLGALPYGSYSIKELPCAANEGLQLIEQPSITISRENYTVELGTFENQIEQTPPDEPTPTPTPSPTPTPAPSSAPTPTPESSPSPSPTSTARVADKTGVDLDGLVLCLIAFSLTGCGLVAYGLHRCRKH